MTGSSFCYYDLLRVPSTATEAEIKVAFRNRILEVHHDKRPSDPDLCYKTIEAYRILSNRESRKQYDTKQDNVFSPPFISARAICYDVKDRPSQRLKSKISQWTEDCKGLSWKDNFFSSYLNVLDKVSHPDCDNSLSYFCEVCNQHFASGLCHYNNILHPYLEYLGYGQSHLSDDELLLFLGERIGDEFDWEPEPLTSVELWTTYYKWDGLPEFCNQVKALRIELPDSNRFTTKTQHLQYLERCTWADDTTISFLRVVLLNNDNANLLSKAKELFLQGDYDDLCVYIGVLKEFLDFDFYDWAEFRNSAITTADVDMFLLWTMVMFQLRECDESEWISLGMSTEKLIPINCKHSALLICFEMGLTDINSVIEQLLLTEHITTAASFIVQYLGVSSLVWYADQHNQNLSASKNLRSIYFSTVLKRMLSYLPENHEVPCNHGEWTYFEEIVYIVQILIDNPFNGLQCIIAMFPEAIGRPELEDMHNLLIKSLESERNPNVHHIRLLAAASHFVPTNEFNEEFLRYHWSQQIDVELAQAANSYDYEELTNILLGLQQRNVDGARITLERLQNTFDDTQMVNSHFTALKLLIWGTIQKINRDWIGAITTYQEVLISTPELNYRLTPAVSKLTQDLSLHVGVIEEMTSRLMEVKHSLRSQSYISISPNSQSVLLSYPIPRCDYKYKELVSKIQSFEPKPTLHETNDSFASFQSTLQPNDISVIAIEKFEKAIETALGTELPIGHLDAAFSYIDLLDSLPSCMRHGPLVMAASHFLQELELTPELNVAFAYRNAIVDLSETLIRLDSTNHAQIQSCLTHKHMFSVLLQANQNISRRKAEMLEPFEQPMLPSQLIPSSEEKMLEQLLYNLVEFSKVEPLLNIPALGCSDLRYVEAIKTRFLHQYCHDKLSCDSQFNTIHEKKVHAQTLFLEVIHQRDTTIVFLKAKEILINSILANGGWNITNVLEFNYWPYSSCSEEGWIDPTACNRLRFHPSFKTFESVQGFEFNFITGRISLTLVEGEIGIFSQQDIFEIFQNQIASPSFVLANSKQDHVLSSEPFKKANYEPCQLAGTDYLKTLLQVCRLLLSFASGMEVNLNPPFPCREVEITMLDGLPEHLQYFLRPLRERCSNESLTSSEAYTFLLSIDECFFQEENYSEFYHYTIGDLKMKLSCTDDNISLDKNHGEEQSSLSFASDFTSSYDELGSYWLVFLRLKELFKLSILCQKINELITTELDGTSYKSKYDSILGSHEIDVDTFRECCWVPSPSCHSHPNIQNVNASVKLDSSRLTYGPVTTSTNATNIPLEELIAPVDFRHEVSGNHDCQNNVTIFKATCSSVNSHATWEENNCDNRNILLGDDREANHEVKLSDATIHSYNCGVIIEPTIVPMNNDSMDRFVTGIGHDTHNKSYVIGCNILDMSFPEVPSISNYAEDTRNTSIDRQNYNASQKWDLSLQSPTHNTFNGCRFHSNILTESQQDFYEVRLENEGVLAQANNMERESSELDDTDKDVLKPEESEMTDTSSAESYSELDVSHFKRLEFDKEKNKAIIDTSDEEFELNKYAQPAVKASLVPRKLTARDRRLRKQNRTCTKKIKIEDNSLNTKTEVTSLNSSTDSSNDEETNTDYFMFGESQKLSIFKSDGRKDELDFDKSETDHEAVSQEESLADLSHVSCLTTDATEDSCEDSTSEKCDTQPEDLEF